VILIDTGPLVALFDRTDNYHNICHTVLKNTRSSLVTTPPVLTEAFYLLGFSWHLQDALWEFIMQGNLQIYNLDGSLLQRCRELMKKYRDIPMDLADASLVTVAERENIYRIFTLDHKDFKVYRTKSGRSFRLIPGRL